jgi:Ca-activated chloride channel family protein
MSSLTSLRLRIATYAALLAVVLAGCGAGAPQQTFQPISQQLPVDGAPGQNTAPAATAAPAAESTAAPAPTMSPAGVPAPADMTAGEAARVAEPLPPAATPAPTQVPGAAGKLMPTTVDHLSTFALDVDTASYSAARAAIVNGSFPNPATVRVEEFVNSFRYGYTPPVDNTFAINIDAARSPFGQSDTQIVRVGIQGKAVDAAQRQPAMLTFVIDVSGSMQEPRRLPLAKEALHLLVDQLNQGDKVAIVVYGSEARVVLEHTGIEQKDRILAAIDSLGDEGSTNAEAGLRLAYDLAARNFKTGTINRVILCSDGVANVGATGPDEILRSIRDYAAQGIYLTTVGFGMDYNDTLMEQLADDGNGNYAYVDNIRAAQRVFVENLTGTLQVIAKDAKVQVDFNPAVVAEYRLLGYENRAVADADFRNDTVDAGEIGAGHTVTALYEIRLTEQAQGDALSVQLRWADPQGGEVHEISRAMSETELGTDFVESTPQFQLAVAVAGFAERLRGDEPAPSLQDIQGIVNRIAPQFTNDPDVQELLDLVIRAGQLEG